MKSIWPAWFQSLSPESQEAYFKEHPNSKLTKLAYSKETKYARAREGDWIRHLKAILKDCIQKEIDFRKNPLYGKVTVISQTKSVEAQLKKAIADYKRKYGNK